MDGVQVYESRSMMGEKLANKIQKMFPDHDIDTVIPIPETSRTAALQCAHILNKPYREGFVKNRYIARTFIMPGQEARRKTVRLKLNTIRSEFSGKNVLLVDDSIVRGTTSIELIQMARDAGAKKVYFASAAPPVRYPNVYGIDIPTRQELVAHGRTIPEIEAILGADHVIYNDLEDVIDAVRHYNPSLIKDMDASCFDGKYITSEVDDEYLEKLESSRGNGRKGVAKDDKKTGNSSGTNSAQISPRTPPFEESKKAIPSVFQKIDHSNPLNKMTHSSDTETNSTRSSSSDDDSSIINPNPNFRSGSCEILHNH